MSLKRKIGLGFGLLAGLMVLLAAIYYYRLGTAVEKYQQQLAAGGEKLSVQQLLPPLAAPESNGAPVFSQAQALGLWNYSRTNLLWKNPPTAMHLILPGKAIVGWAQPDVREEGTNSWAEIEALLAESRSALDLACEAAQYPVLDFHLNYRLGPGLLLPHLAPLKGAAQRLTIAALCDLHRGDTLAATTNLEAILALVKGMSEERLVISQLVRIAMAQIAMTANWELLQAPGLTDESLAAVQRRWTEVKFVQPAELSLEMERALGELMLERMRSSRAQFRQILWGRASSSAGSTPGQSGEELLREIVLSARETHWRLFQSYPDQLRALKGYQVLLESFRRVEAGQGFDRAFRDQQARLAAAGFQASEDDSNPVFNPSGSSLAWLFSGSVLSLGRVFNRVHAAEAARQLAITATALKRYHLAHGQYPPELSALAPEFLAKVPTDPADGQPLRYRLKPDGTFLLYAIGEDGVDNGGDASPQEQSKSFTWYRGRDLVWPAPATTEEIRAAQQKKR